MTLSSIIRVKMVERGLSNHLLAERVGVCDTTMIANLKKEPGRVKAILLHKIAGVLDLPVDVFCRKEEGDA